MGFGYRGWESSGTLDFTQWNNQDWESAGIGALIGGGIGLGLSSTFGLSGTGFTGTGATNWTWDVVSNGLITGNINMASKYLQGERDVHDLFWSGAIGFTSGAFGGLAGNLKHNGKYRTWLPESIKLQNTITSTINGFFDRLYLGNSQGLKGLDLLLYGGKGAAEGLYFSHLANKNSLINFKSGKYTNNSYLFGRYVSGALGSIGTSVPGLGSTVSRFHGLLLGMKQFYIPAINLDYNWSFTEEAIRVALGGMSMLDLWTTSVVNSHEGSEWLLPTRWLWNIFNLNYP